MVTLVSEYVYIHTGCNLKLVLRKLPLCYMIIMIIIIIIVILQAHGFLGFLGFFVFFL